MTSLGPGRLDLRLRPQAEGTEPPLWAAQRFRGPLGLFPANKDGRPKFGWHRRAHGQWLRPIWRCGARSAPLIGPRRIWRKVLSVFRGWFRGVRCAVLHVGIPRGPTRFLRGSHVNPLHRTNWGVHSDGWRGSKTRAGGGRRPATKHLSTVYVWDRFSVPVKTKRCGFGVPVGGSCCPPRNRPRGYLSPKAGGARATWGRRAEIRPLEPAPGHAGEGKRGQ